MRKAGMGISELSQPMRLLKSIGLERFSWALRRFHCPVSPDDLVLEVGSGGNPYPRANVLLDAYETTRERHWAALCSDRPTVLGFAENLPFRDRAFDFVIAAHVLEHSPQPERFINELQRVAQAGYIEVPDAFLERVNPYRDHRLEITCRNKTLLITKKESWCPGGDIVELYEDRVKPFLTRELIPHHPYLFHVRYYWENKIAFQVLNPEIDAGWDAPRSEFAAPPVTRGNLRQGLRGVLRAFLSQNKRNKNIDLFGLLRCPNCYSLNLEKEDTKISCDGCDSTYRLRRNMAVMNEGRNVE